MYITENHVIIPEPRANGLVDHVLQNARAVDQRAGQQMVAHGVDVVLRNDRHSKVVIGETVSSNDHSPGAHLCVCGG